MPNKQDTTAKVHQRDKVKNSLKINQLPWTENQKHIINAILDKKTRVVFIDGVAGTGKTYLAAYCGLQMLSDKKVSELIYIRTVIESASKGLGYLPGEFDDKFKPFLAPLEDKIQELIDAPSAEILKKEHRVRAIPVNYLRGCSFNANFLLGDECQNFEAKEIITTLTRIGKFSKLVLCGDSFQSDVNGRSGFKKIMSIFDNEMSRANGIFCFYLHKDDIVRDDIIKYILGTLQDNGLTSC